MSTVPSKNESTETAGLCAHSSSRLIAMYGSLERTHVADGAAGAAAVVAVLRPRDAVVVVVGGVAVGAGVDAR